MTKYKYLENSQGDYIIYYAPWKTQQSSMFNIKIVGFIGNHPTLSVGQSVHVMKEIWKDLKEINLTIKKNIIKTIFEGDKNGNIRIELAWPEKAPA